MYSLGEYRIVRIRLSLLGSHFPLAKLVPLHELIECLRIFKLLHSKFGVTHSANKDLGGPAGQMGERRVQLSEGSRTSWETSDTRGSRCRWCVAEPLTVPPREEGAEEGSGRGNFIDEKTMVRRG